MWYFTWILGVGFAILAAIVAAMHIEAQDEAEKR
ncbi:MAG: cytochrome bd-I oxidase subunit CydX [Candidatus Accumulibacter sp.]|jgi:cyd operon protein YbgT|nr:cytochrome bd-I oxidase subunit CydX [Accumulibacter sp.]